MDDGADLPDHDYASIYGHAALRARTLALLGALMARQEAHLRTLEHLIAEQGMECRQEHTHPEQERHHPP
jgi:hypothetical protein